MIIHEWTGAVAAEIIATDRRAKRNLKIALAKIRKRIQLLGVLPASTSEGGPSAPSDSQIKKLKRKVKGLQKKDYKGASKPGRQDEASDDFIPKAVLDAIRQMVEIIAEITSASFLVVGNGQPWTIILKKVTEASWRKIKMMNRRGMVKKRRKRHRLPHLLQVLLVMVHLIATLRIRTKSHKIGSLHVVSYKILKTVATLVRTPTNNTTICRAEVDSRADTVCCGKTFRMIKQSPPVATVPGFHGDLGALNDVPITNCCTAIDLPDLQEMRIVICNEALYFGTGIEDLLISPNQLWVNGLIVDTCPKQFSGGKSMHGIYVPDEDIFIPF
jgi:hypothetical protein